jgi:quercetin dioxygenase-like cupin family protein
MVCMTDELQPIGDTVLYEDDEVRIWKLDLDPGEASPVHEHHHDYVFVVVAGGSTETVDSDGSSSRATDSVGDAIHHQAPLAHHLRNVGDSRYVNVIVELLQTGDG